MTRTARALTAALHAPCAVAGCRRTVAVMHPLRFEGPDPIAFVVLCEDHEALRKRDHAHRARIAAQTGEAIEDWASDSLRTRIA